MSDAKLPEWWKHTKIWCQAHPLNDSEVANIEAALRERDELREKAQAVIDWDGTLPKAWVQLNARFEALRDWLEAHPK